MIGNFTLPSTCPTDCDVTNWDDSPDFGGLQRNIDPNFRGEDTAGTPNRFREVVPAQPFRFIKKPDEEIYALVLKYKVQIGERAKPPQPEDTETFYVAYELAKKPSGAFDDSPRWEPLRGGYAYHSSYSGAEGTKPMLILMSE